MSFLTPINPQKTTAVTTITDDAPLPEAVKAALHQSLAAFASSANVPAEDRAANRMAYKIAMKGFHVALAIETLEHLMLHNPRNPFQFTPQDVYEYAGKLKSKWAKAVVSVLLDPMGERMWETSIGGPLPFQPGCKIPDEIASEAMRLALTTCVSSNWNSVTRMPEDRFAKLNKAWFADKPLPNDEGPASDYTHAAAVAERAKIVEDRKFEAYLAKLDPELRQHRRYAIQMFMKLDQKPTEEEILAEAQRRWDEEKASRARWAAECDHLGSQAAN